MPKIVSLAEYEAVLAAVELCPDRAGLEAIEARMRTPIARRTLQRRLGELVGQGRLLVEGKRRGAVYRLPPRIDAYAMPGLTNAPVANEPAGENDTLPLSDAGARLRAAVRRPLIARAPVGYRREFLLDYQPNQTWYLPDATRKHLRALGAFPEPPRPPGTFARDVLARLLIDLSWASSKLEGNTYSRLDTQRLIEQGEVAAGKDAGETQMILNHKRAIEFLVEGAEDLGYDMHTFVNLHALLAENLLPDPRAGGRLRERIVDISGTVYRPLAIAQQIEEFFRAILERVARIVDPIEQAFFLMVHIPLLQPFEDVNKRVSRVGANIPLIKHDLCPLSFVEVPERAYVDATLAVYEENRVELLADVFAWAYERSCQQYRAIAGALPRPDPFRLRHRAALSDVVGAVVRQGWHPAGAVIERAAAPLVPAGELARFVAMAIDELQGLHEGNIARHRLRRSEFLAWQAARRDQS